MEQNWAMSIKNIYNIFKKELAFQSYSKMLVMLLLPLLFISSGYIYVHYKNTIDSYQQFKKTEDEYKELGIDIKQALASPVKVKEGELKSEDGDGEIVENILRFDYENFVLSLHHLEPKQSVIMTLELMGFIIFPLAFTLYAIYISSYDIRFKTVKVKAVSHDWKSVLLAKQCSVYMVMAAAVIAVVCTAYVSSFVFYSLASRAIPVGEFTKPAVSKSNIPLQLVVVLAVSFIFSTVGFYLGVLFRSFITPALLYIVYSLLIPALGRFDLKNLLSNLGHAVFSFSGGFKLFTPVKVDMIPVVIILAASIGLLSAVTYYMAHRQSKYVV